MLKGFERQNSDLAGIARDYACFFLCCGAFCFSQLFFLCKMEKGWFLRKCTLYKMENGEAFVEMPSIKWVRLCTYDTLSLSVILMILFWIKNSGVVEVWNGLNRFGGYWWMVQVTLCNFSICLQVLGSLVSMVIYGVHVAFHPTPPFYRGLFAGVGGQCLIL